MEPRCLRNSLLILVKQWILALLDALLQSSEGVNSWLDPLLERFLFGIGLLIDSVDAGPHIFRQLACFNTLLTFLFDRLTFLVDLVPKRLLRGVEFQLPLGK